MTIGGGTEIRVEQDGNISMHIAQLVDKKLDLFVLDADFVNEGTPLVDERGALLSSNLILFLLRFGDDDGVH